MSSVNVTTASLTAFDNAASIPRALDQLPPVISELDHLACLSVSGDDACDFLQGQFTNQISDLATGQCQLTGYCNPKGRALAVLWLLKRQSGFYLLVPRDISDNILKRLQLYRMRAKVVIAEEQDAGIYGLINTGDQRSNIAGSLECWTIDEYRSFVRVGNAEDQQWRSGLTLPVTDPDSWRLAQILAAEPMIYAQTVESLIPQHMNLDLANGVSFTKGCYPGQEIIARLRYLGKLKQRMIIGLSAIAGKTTPGTPVFTRQKGEQKAGIVVDTITVGTMQYLSVNVPSTVIDQGDVHIGSVDGPVLDRLAMPYEITLEKEKSKSAT